MDKESVQNKVDAAEENAPVESAMGAKDDGHAVLADQTTDTSVSDPGSSVENEGVPDKSASADPENTDASNSDADDELSQEESAEKGEHEIRAIFEALLFLSNEALPLSFFTKNFNMDPTDIKIILDSLVDEYEERDGGMKLIEIANGFQFVTNPVFSKDIRRIMGFRRKEPLTKSMLETLSIIAYKQPIILAEIDELRGVSSRMIVAGLMKRNLIKPVGRKELPGRPLAYGTTDEFLRFFGLSRLTDLPKLSEIKEFSYDEV